MIFRLKSAKVKTLAAGLHRQGEIGHMKPEGAFAGAIRARR